MNNPWEITRLRDLGYERCRRLADQTLEAFARSAGGPSPDPHAKPLPADEGPELPLPLRVLAALCAMDVRLRGVEAARHEPAAIRVGFRGGNSPLALAWIEAAIYFPFSLFMDVPEDRPPDSRALSLALQAGARIFLSHDPQLAADGVQVFCLAEAPALPLDQLLACAAPEATLLAWDPALEPELAETRRFPPALRLAMERALVHALRREYGPDTGPAARPETC